MSGGAIFFCIIIAMFPGIILIAVAVKLWEVRQASRWPSAKGQVLSSGISAKTFRPGDMSYNFGDSNVENQPYVEYEYMVGSQKHRCRRITIGEKVSGHEFESLLEKYPVGSTVTVYYNPAKPEQALLERDLPPGIWLGLVAILAFFLGGPAILAFFYFVGLDWLKSHMPNPHHAPFVAALGTFSAVVLFFAYAFTRYARQSLGWPTAPGKIVASGIDEYKVWQDSHTTSSYGRTHYKSAVMYEYEVNGRKYVGDRVKVGVTMSGTVQAIANHTASKYPTGMEVEVFYNPENPSESVLVPNSNWFLFPWLIGLTLAGFTWALATGRMG